MTIKELKQKYAHYEGYANIKYVIASWDDTGKCLIIVAYERIYGAIWRDVVQAVRLSDNAELIPAGSCRPCDNLQDAIDVAREMITVNKP